MTISSLSAARTLAEMREWNVSNLELQKLIYLAHMLSLGENDAPLIREAFEAWDYGPVVPALYHHLKGFGSNRVGNVFHATSKADPESIEYRCLEEIEHDTREFSAGQLVAITHRNDGAWAKSYTPGLKGIVIPNNEIRSEYERFYAA